MLLLYKIKANTVLKISHVCMSQRWQIKIHKDGCRHKCTIRRNKVAKVCGVQLNWLFYWWTPLYHVLFGFTFVTSVQLVTEKLSVVARRSADGWHAQLIAETGCGLEQPDSPKYGMYSFVLLTEDQLHIISKSISNQLLFMAEFIQYSNSTALL